MTSQMNECNTSIEADSNLVHFKTWQAYLDTLVEVADHKNLRRQTTARTVAALGYRTTGDTLTEKEFYDLRLQQIVQGTQTAIKVISEGSPSLDPLMRELANRESDNRNGLLHTIIFVRHVTRLGFEISGYIDYSHRLLLEDWTPYFKGDRKIWPQTSDLGYYHWKNGRILSNDTKNFKVIIDPKRGLLFQNRHDRKIINPNPSESPGENAIRKHIYSDRYNQVTLFDHLTRKRS